jgi:hypothetical protein
MGKGKCQLIVTRKRWKSFMAKLKDVTRKIKPMSFDERLRKRGYMSVSEMFKVISKTSDMYTLFPMF